jgi:hypothetical protein
MAMPQTKHPEADGRKTRGRERQGASFPVTPVHADLPDGYPSTLAEIKQRIQAERLRVVMAANSAMVLLYWDIGRLILDRQEREGGARRLGCQGYRPALGRFAAGLPGHDRPFPKKS